MAPTRPPKYRYVARSALPTSAAPQGAALRPYETLHLGKALASEDVVVAERGEEVVILTALHRAGQQPPGLLKLAGGVLLVTQGL